MDKKELSQYLEKPQAVKELFEGELEKDEEFWEGNENPKIAEGLSIDEKNTIYLYYFKKLELKEQIINVRSKIMELYINTFELYKDIGLINYVGQNIFTINNIISGIEVNEDGIITGWSEISWSCDIIVDYIKRIEKILSIKDNIEKNNNFTKKENVLINMSNQMIGYFCDNQNIFGKLRKKLNLCAEDDISELDGLIYELSEMSKQVAQQSLEKFREYEEKFKALKDVIKN